MQVDPFIFRAYDIRGVMGKTLTGEVMRAIGFCAAKRWPGCYCVSCDIRESSPALARELINGLLAGGARVLDAGAQNFGCALFSGLQSEADYNFFVTASHLPPEWNGLKCYTGAGNALSPADLQDLRRDVEALEGAPPANGKEEKVVDFTEAYTDFFANAFHVRKGMKVVVDCGGGATCLTAPEAFRKAGFEVVGLFTKVDPLSRDRPSEPDPRNLTALREKVLQEKADFGVAFDGDGDRAALVDERGNFLTGIELGIVLGEELVRKNRGGLVLMTMACSMRVRQVLEPLGANVDLIPVGHTFVIRGCAERGAIFGMEQSGHYVLPDYFAFDDGLLIPFKIAEIMSERNAKLSELASIVQPCFAEYAVQFPCADEKKFGVADRLVKELAAKHPDSRQNTMDGLRLDWKDAWVLVRASNTGPKLLLYIEATTQERFTKLRAEFAELLEKAVS
ncbi:hypothetical protein HYS54_04665 [Candidatus Micrarchaeota archaeon]|nr:hypothetical protein [Candidatus Micrarchaeota archaeon]